MGTGRDAVGRSGRPNSLGMRSRQLATLLDALDTGAEGAAASQRRYSRWPFRLETLLFELAHPGGSQVAFKVACRNISCGGTSVLHAQYVHPGSACGVILPHRERGHARIRGTVRRCRHVAGVVHEIGVQFERVIDVREFVDEHVARDRYTLERVAPESLEGRLVYVNSVELDQQILRHFLKETRLRLATAVDLGAMHQMMPGGCDVLMVDMAGVGLTGTAWVSELRDAGVHAPLVVLLPPGVSGVDRAELERAGADGSLPKPLMQETLLRALAEILSVPTMVASGGGAARGDASLSGRFLEQLKKYTAELREQIKAGEAMACYVICQHLKGGGQSLGFERITRTASAAADRIAQSMSVQESSAELRELVSACERTAASASAA